MAIKWLCTGRSKHAYQYKNAEGKIQNGYVVAYDFKSEIDTESKAGSVNELFDTKPVLTEAGVEALVGLQVYPQGFTVYADNRLSNMEATSVLEIGEAYVSMSAFFAVGVGDYLTLDSGDSGGGDGGNDK